MIKLIPKRTFALEENCIDVGEVRKFIVKELQIIRDTPHGHIALHNVITAPVNAS